MKRSVLFLLLCAALLALAPAGGASPDTGLDDPSTLESHDPSEELSALDAESDVVSAGPSAKVIKNVALFGRGVRLMPNATTDVWAHDGYAYIGTFNDPCGDGTGANGSGVHIFDVRNPTKVKPAGQLPSVEGSRINDVKVADMNSGTILVHSNEACAGGDGGFEVYEVSNPRNPVHLASARVDDPNETLRNVFGDVNVGVHNLFLFTQGSRDYVAMQTHAFFGSFQIYELTDPTNPQFVSAWGAELLCEEAFCSDDPYNETDIPTLIDHIVGYMFGGFGTSQNRFLHDVTVSADGTKAYLSNWDAGLILLDISDPANPEYVSTALDPANGSLDGEVNSHAAWPTENGRYVVETEEDFDTPFSVPSITFQDVPTNTIPGVASSTVAGDAFEASQTANVITVTPSSITVDSGPLAGQTFPAREGAGNQPRLSTLGGSITGQAVWIGLACDGDPIANADEIDAGGDVDIAIARRGDCFFREKLKNAAAAGADAIVIVNNDASVWGGVRIWDYSNPENPVLASTFNTVCSADPAAEPCDPRGTYSVHNVIVEKGKAYISWYSDGVLVLDISDPFNPVEVGRYHRAGEEFEAQNGGIQDVWGIHKERGKPWLYASDRNGGLYVLKEYGSGSAKKGKR